METVISQPIKKDRIVSFKFVFLRSLINMLVLTGIITSCTNDGSDGFTIMQGYFKQSITETGELDAIRASYLTMPRINYLYGSQFKIIGLAEHGKQVGRGDSVIMLDPASIYKYILEREDQLEIEKASLEKQKVEMQNSIQELTALLRNEQGAYDLKKLEVERMKFESESKRKIKELEFRQATVRLNKAKRKLELKPALNNYDMMILQIRVQQRENEIRDGKAAVKMLKMSSPLDGIFQIKRNYNGQLVKIGDNVYSNNLIASIPDISKMKVKTYVNEADITKIKPTTKVLIRLDAMPSVIFNGSVSYISKVCIPRENEKVFTVNLEVAESDIRLKPGMTVSCEYLCNESGDQLYVPNNCLYRENGKSFIFLKKGGSSKKVEVKAGASNANHTLIAGDFKPGQKLIPVEKIEEIN